MKDFILISAFCSVIIGYAQADSLSVIGEKKAQSTSFKANPFDANAPAKAAFYSAILPGLGQAYNGSYWKIPLVYAAIGTSTYLYIDNNQKYNTYRDAYKRRLAGYQDDEFIDFLTEDDLIEAQKLFRQNRDFSLMFIIGFYILNIIDANVEAHLDQFSISEDLSFKPSQTLNPATGQNAFGLTLKLNLN